MYVRGNPLSRIDPFGLADSTQEQRNKDAFAAEERRKDLEALADEARAQCNWDMYYFYEHLAYLALMDYYSAIGQPIAAEGEPPAPPRQPAPPPNRPPKMFEPTSNSQLVPTFNMK